jgi:hypothetical protein
MNDLNGTWTNDGGIERNTSDIRKKNNSSFRLSKRMKRKRAKE